MPKVQITKEAIEKSLQDGAKTMSELYRALDGKSKPSGSFSRKIRSFCTNLDERLRANQKENSKIPNKTLESTVKKAKSISNAQGNPYRTNSAYSVVWNCLYQTRKKGINRRELLKQVMELSNKPEQNCKFNISVVSSPKEDGSCHRSAKVASDAYWVERQNDWLKLHLRNTTD